MLEPKGNNPITLKDKKKQFRIEIRRQKNFEYFRKSRRALVDRVNKPKSSGIKVII